MSGENEPPRLSRRKLLVGAAAASGVALLDRFLPSIPVATARARELQQQYLPPMGVISESVTTYREASAVRTDAEVESDRNYQPEPSYYTADYYVWAGNPDTNPTDLIDPNDRASRWFYWEDNGRNPPHEWDAMYLPDITPGGGFNPRYGLYDSSNKRVIEWQLSLLRKAKMDVAFVSWWGRNHRSDKVFKYIVKKEMKKIDTPYPRLRFAIIYEPDLRGGKSSREIESDLQYLMDEYGSEPEMLKIGGKPVVFAYALEGNGLEKVKKISSITQKLGFHYVAQVYPGYRDNLSSADSWRQYGPAVRTDDQGEFSGSVSAGYWSRTDNRFLARDLGAFTNAVRWIIKSPAMWKNFILNELGEGTGFEPAIPVIFRDGKAMPHPSREKIGKEIEILAELIPNRR